MTERSLDEFAGDGTTEREAAEPSVPTMRWSADGDACPNCGETVPRQWRDGDAFVCADCKDW